MPLTAEQRASIPRPTIPNDTPPDVLDGLKAAITSNDENAFSGLLQSYVGSESCTHVQDLAPVLKHAINEDRPYYVTELFRSGVKMHFHFALDAISAKAKQSLETLMEMGWDINENISKTEPDVLHRAFEDAEMTFWMLDHGADLNKQTYLDVTPMSLATVRASPELIRKLLDRGADVTKGELLHYALDRKTDISQVISLLLGKGAPINTIKYANHPVSSNHFFWMDLGTPLHEAAHKGKADIVQLLLDHGADTTVKSSQGRTAKEVAEKYGHSDVVRVLESQKEKI